MVTYIVFFVLVVHTAVMRTTIADQLLHSEGDELLTTGEAAKLLNSSRQHVVDLCERGDLGFVTVGTHRRVRRSDVEAHRTRTARMSRDQRRSLWLAHAVAGEIARDPQRAQQLALDNLDRLRPGARGQAVRWLDEWERLLHGSLIQLLTQLTSPSPKGRELRQNSPFAGVVDEQTRSQVLEAWAERERSDTPT
jgi:excisionase family DNA binding protein